MQLPERATPTPTSRHCCGRVHLSDGFAVTDPELTRETSASCGLVWKLPGPASPSPGIQPQMMPDTRPRASEPTVAAGLLVLCWLVLVAARPAAAEASMLEARLLLDPVPNRIIGNSNPVYAVRAEVLQPAVTSAIALAHSFPAMALKEIEVSCPKDGDAVLVRQLAGSTNIFGTVVEDLRWYILERARGHSAQFLLGCLTNSAWRLSDPAPDAKALARRYPNLPTALLRKWDTGSYTNRAGTTAELHTGETYAGGVFHAYTNKVVRGNDETVRWTNYILVDGEIAWIYQVRHPPLDPAFETVGVADAKEFDPRFRESIVNAEKEARAELESRGEPPTKWRIDRLKKERLKVRGIDWRSPVDLSPGPRRDWDRSPLSLRRP